MRQSVGQSASGGMDALFGRVTLDGLGAADGPPARTLEAKAGYGMPVLQGRFIGTPWLGFSQSEDSETLRAGWTLARRARDGRAMELGLEGTQANNHAGARTEHAMLVRVTARW